MTRVSSVVGEAEDAIMLEDLVVTQPIASFLTTDFVNRTARELATSGFVTDEHAFAPSRETIVTHWEAIEAALHEAGHPVELRTGFFKNSATFVYYIYDANHLESAEIAEFAVSAWIDPRYP